MTNFSDEQIKELKEYSAIYSQIQRTGIKFYIAKTVCKTFNDRPVLEDADISLDKMAIRLRESIQHYRENTPLDIQEIFEWGKPLGTLESLATNQLLKE